MTEESQNEKIKLFVYLRVSTEMQTIEMQESVLLRFLKNHPELEVVDKFIDDAITGAFGWERPSLKDMFDRIDEVEGIILYSWDRISREEEFAVNLMYGLRRRNKIVYVSSTGEKLDFNELPARLKTFIDSAYAEKERKMIKKRQKDGIEAYKKKYGRWGAKIKWGTSLTGSPISEAMFWKLYKQYRLADISKSGIARILNIGRPTLYKRLNDNKEKYNKIELNIQNKDEE